MNNDNERGAAMVESILGMAIILLVSMGLLTLTQVVWTHLDLSSTTRDVARYAARVEYDPSPSVGSVNSSRHRTEDQIAAYAKQAAAESGVEVTSPCVISGGKAVCGDVTISPANPDALRTGDEITALGFPALASLDLDDPLKPALTVTRGVVSTFEADSTIGSSRAWIDSDVRIGHGNSGGASINTKGELVGINSAIITTEVADENGSGATQGSSLIRPVALASDILKIAEDGGDPSYVSPYLDSMPAPDEQTAGVSVVSNGWADESSKGTCAGTSSVDTPASLPGRSVGETIYAEFTVTGIADGTPVAVDYYDLSGKHVIDSTSASWTYGAEAVCIDIPFTISEPIDGVNAAFSVGTGGEVIAQNPVLFQ